MLSKTLRCLKSARSAERRNPLPLLHRVRVASMSPNRTRPEFGISSPAITRRSVVFPEPDGPRSAISSPARIEVHAPQGRRVAELFFQIDDGDVHSESPVGERRDPKLRLRSAIRGWLCRCDEGETSQERSDGEGSHEIVFIVKDLDVKGHGGVVGTWPGRRRRRRTRPWRGHCTGEPRTGEPSGYSAG